MNKRQEADLAVVNGIAITNEQAIQKALAHLRLARDYLKEGGATRAVDRVRHALKSAEGAARNEHVQQRQR